MAAFAFDENFKPVFNDLILRIEDKSLLYDNSALPIVPLNFDSIIITEALHASENSSVYSGYFTDREGKRYEDYDVCFKFGDDERLCREADRYDVMSSLQGTAIPRLIGLAWAKQGKDYLGCLMTERFGCSLDCDLMSLAKSEKAIILNHLNSIHAEGIIPVDFNESNVLQRGSEFRLVGFDHMLETHQCTASGKAIDFTEQPDSLSTEDYNAICRYVRDYAFDMDFWDGGTVAFKNFIWNKEGLPSSRMMELLFPAALYSKYLHTQALPELLQRYFKHAQTLLESGRRDVEYLKAHINETVAEVEKEWLRSHPTPAQTKRAGKAKSGRRAARTEVV